MIAVCPFNEPKANVEAVATTKQTRKRINRVNKCIRAKKSFFVLSPEDSIHADILQDIFLNGKIISVPHKGEQEYKHF